jgi:23S rRNA pseudouridine1911/1915/1917 synthase
MLISSRDASQWQKQYAAWVYGSIPPGTTREIDISIAHHPSNQSKMVALTDKQAHRGKPRTANTLFQSIPYQTNPFPDSVAATPLLINIVQGTRHQIRVHLASIGHPIVGDTLYGPDTREDNGPHESEKRMYLHAFSYTLPSPPLPMAVTVTSLPPFPFPSLDHCETTDQTSQQS